MSSPLLTAPVLPTLLRLSAPGLLLVAFQSMVSHGAPISLPWSDRENQCSST